MLQSLPSRLLALLPLVLLLWGSGAGSVQANTCQRAAAELAALPAGGGARDPGLARRYQAESQRIGGEIAALGCNRNRLFIFGDSAPPQCAGLRQRYAQMQAGVAHYGQPQAGANEARRRQLSAFLASESCRQTPEPRRERSVINAGLFDDGRAARRSEIEIRADDDDEEERAPVRRAVPRGGKAVCVRLCDGFFFPVNMSRRDARQDGDEICQSQCPATETRVYFMTSREIDRAVNTDGESYQSHANAFRYRKSFDPTCGCKRAGATWAETLRGAEDRMTSRSGDITVPGDGGGIAVIGGRPQPDEVVLRGINSVGFNPDRPRAPPRETAPEQPAVEPLPGTVDIPKIEGETREVTGRDGVTRSVRVVSPPPAPVR